MSHRSAKNNFHCSVKNFFINNLEEIARTVVLLELALVEDHDPVVVHDGVESVGDGEDAAPGKLLPDGRLDEVISLQVNSRGGLIQDQNLKTVKMRKTKKFYIGFC